MSELTLSVCVEYSVLSLMTVRLRRRGQLALSEQTPCLVSEPHGFEFLVRIVHCGGELSILTAAVVTLAIDELMNQSGRRSLLLHQLSYLLPDFLYFLPVSL